MKHRFVTHYILSAFLCGFLCAGPIACSVDQVIGLIQDAAVIASAAGPVISSIAPQYGGLVALAGKGLSDLASLYAKFEKASSTEKPGLAGQIHALTSTTLDNLQTIFADAAIKDADTRATITAFVTAANTAIVALELKLGAPSSQPANVQAHAHAMSQARTLPVIPNAKTGDDLKKYWNGQVGAAHPNAIVK